MDPYSRNRDCYYDSDPDDYRENRGAENFSARDESTAFTKAATKKRLLRSAAVLQRDLRTRKIFKTKKYSGG